jgi:hypothetical protein
MNFETGLPGLNAYICFNALIGSKIFVKARTGEKK